MANRYWRGGSAAWDGTAGTKWSLTSGGAGGQAVPTAADDVFFDANSGASTVTISTGNTGAKSITCTGFTGTLTGTAAISVAGNVTLAAGMSYSYTGVLTLTATGSITSAGKTFGPITIDAAASTVTLAAALTLSGTSTFILTNGTISLGSFTLTTGLFSSSGATARTIAFGTGKIVLNSSATNTIWDTSTPTSLTVSGSRLVEVTGGGTAVTKVINANSAMGEANCVDFSFLETTGSVTVGFAANTTVRNWIVNCSSGTTIANSGNNFLIYGSFSHLTTNGNPPYSGGISWQFSSTSSQTITTNGLSIAWQIIFNGVGGSWALQDNLTLITTQSILLSNGTLNLNNFTLSTGTFSSTNANARVIAFGSTGKIQLKAATTIGLWNTSNVTNFSYTGNSRIEVIGTGSGVTKTITVGAMAESQALNWFIDENSGASANTITFTLNSGLKNLTVNAANGGKYQISNIALTIYGDYTYAGNYVPGYASVFFNGTTSTIRNLTSASQQLNLDTGDWTVEAWIYKTISQQGVILALPNVASGSNTGFSFQTTAANEITQNNGVTATVNAGSISLNTWTHVAAVRTSGNTQLYVNGVAVGATFTQTPSSSQYFAIGCNITATFAFFPGYISNLRLVKGVAVYSGNFTPPSLGPLATSGAASVLAYSSTTNVNTSFAASATSILACQTAMDFVEKSIYKFPIAIIGTPTASYLNPYNSNGFPLINQGTSVWTFAATGTQTITTAGLAHDFPIIFNGIGGTFTLQDSFKVGITRTTTLTNGTLNLNNLTLSTGVFSSNNTNTRVIAFGSTGKIQLIGDTSGTQIWNTTSSTNFSYTGTSNIETNTGAAVTKSITIGSMTEGQSLNFNLLDVAGTMTFTSGSAVRNLTVNGTFTLSNAAITIYGNYLYTAATAISSGVSAWTFGSTSTQSINTGGLTHSFPWTFNGASGTFNLSSAVTIGSTSTLTLTNGTLKLNGYTFISGAFATGIGTKNLTFDAGTLSIVFIGNVFNNANPTGFTTTAGTGVGTIRLTGSSAKTFTGGGSIYNCTLDQGGLGALTIADSNTFNDITNSYKATNATTLTFTSGTTTTVNNFTASGEVGRLLTINSSTPGSAATLSKSTGSVSVSYCSIFNSAATGGATWEALTTNGNINSGGNSGWIFGVVLSTGNMLLMF